MLMFPVQWVFRLNEAVLRSWSALVGHAVQCSCAVGAERQGVCEVQGQ